MSISASWSTPIHDATTSYRNNCSCCYCSITCREMSWNSLGGWIFVMRRDLGTRITSEWPACFTSCLYSSSFKVCSIGRRRSAFSIPSGRFRRLIDLAPCDTKSPFSDLNFSARAGFTNNASNDRDAVRDAKLLEDTWESPNSNPRPVLVFTLLRKGLLHSLTMHFSPMYESLV